MSGGGGLWSVTSVPWMRNIVDWWWNGMRNIQRRVVKCDAFHLILHDFGFTGHLKQCFAWSCIYFRSLWLFYLCMRLFGPNYFSAFGTWPPSSSWIQQWVDPGIWDRDLLWCYMLLPLTTWATSVRLAVGIVAAPSTCCRNDGEDLQL